MILAHAGADKEAALIVPLDRARLDVVRAHGPFIRDRRLATQYEKLAASFAAMITLAVIRLYLTTHSSHTP